MALPAWGAPWVRLSAIWLVLFSYCASGTRASECSRPADRRAHGWLVCVCAEVCKRKLCRSCVTQNVRGLLHTRISSQRRRPTVSLASPYTLVYSYCPYANVWSRHHRIPCWLGRRCASAPAAKPSQVMCTCRRFGTFIPSVFRLRHATQHAIHGGSS